MVELLDGRDYVELRIGSSRHTLFMKYQGPEIDVAVLDGKLLVRARELTECIFEGKKEDMNYDLEPLPAFAWLAPTELLLCFSAPGIHYSTLQEMENYVERKDREPCRAARLETRGAPQAGVVFES